MSTPAQCPAVRRVFYTRHSRHCHEAFTEGLCYRITDRSYETEIELVEQLMRQGINVKQYEGVSVKHAFSGRWDHNLVRWTRI